LPVNQSASAAYLFKREGKKMLRTTRVLTVVLALGAVVQMRAGGGQDVDVTGAWAVTITKPSGSASGLAILSQDGAKVTGMIGPAETDMMPAEGTVDGNKLTLLTRPRTGRTAAFAKCELTGTRDRMTGTIDSDKGTIEFIRKQRQK
jgi:hypothetical protein